ncbi:alpha/beta fold hydrolase [Azospirillum endophyticum]
MDILLIPGFMLDADLWREVRPRLERFGRVVDADTMQDDTIQGMAARAAAMLSGPAVVVGFSMGGYVARELVYQAPDKVRALALVATSSRGDHGAEASAAAKSAPGFRRLARASVIRSLHPDHRSDALVARVQAMSQRLGAGVFERQSRMRRHDDTLRLAQIRCPALVVAAAHDELRSVAESRTLHDGIAGSAMMIIERSGHLVPLEQPLQLANALEALCMKATGSR